MPRRAADAAGGGVPAATPDRSGSGLPRVHVGDAAASDLAERLRAGASLVGIDLREARLVDLVLDGRDLSRAKFSEAVLVRCSFRGCALAGAVFFGATLQEVSFEDANLEGADLDYASLNDVNFRGARLRGATLPGRAAGRARVEESVRAGTRVRFSARRTDDA